MVPTGKPAKSPASQPLVEVPGGFAPIGTTTSTGVTGTVTSPEPEYSLTTKSASKPSTYRRGEGLTRSSSVLEVWKASNEKGWMVTS